MLCVRCKKNQATKTYERLKNGNKEMEYYCLSCYSHVFSEMVETPVYSACPYCGTTSTEIKKRNLVGCAYCYKLLEPTLYPMIKKMQNATVHVGIAPYETTAEQTEKRCQELQALSKKCYEEK